MNSVIYLLISLRDYEAIFVINMLLSNVIIDIVMIVIITVLFYILREKNSEKVIIKGEKENTSMDLGTEEIMINKTIKEKKETPKTTKKNTNNRKSTKTNNSKTTSKSGKKTTKTVNNSKKTVKKENN